MRYRSSGGDKVEDGVISSISPHFIFVLYDGTTTPAATDRNNLEWRETPPPEPPS